MLALDPKTWFSPPPGTDGALIDREAIGCWTTCLAERCSHVQVRTFGSSTEGRPLDAIYIADGLGPPTLADLQGRRRLEVERLLSGEQPAPNTPPVVVVTSGIHATEIGGPQSMPELLFWLATSPAAVPIRQRVLTIVIPTLNPDGFDLVTRWHTETLGSELAGSMPPRLYHRFAGHDNNRDWLFRNLKEPRAALDEIFSVWLPHVTLDQHQMDQHGPRFVLPPYAEPWEPHVPADIIASSNAPGQAIAADMTHSGLSGLVTGRYFDAWEPSRALQHYRGGIRILAEAASADIAHPMTVSAEQLAAAPLPQPATPGAHCPAPWPGARGACRTSSPIISRPRNRFSPVSPRNPLAGCRCSEQRWRPTRHRQRRTRYRSPRTRLTARPIASLSRCWHRSEQSVKQAAWRESPPISQRVRSSRLSSVRNPTLPTLALRRIT